MKSLLTILISVTIATGAIAQSKPFQLSLTPGIAIVDRNERVAGLSLSIWGENPQSAAAYGIVNGSTGSSAGLSLAILFNYSDDYAGVQLAPVNYTHGDALGLQAGVVNYAGGTMKGLQTGTFNYAGRLTGLQLGVINYAEHVDAGLQIGAINLIPKNQWFKGLPSELAPGMVFLNWRL